MYSKEEKQQIRSQFWNMFAYRSSKTGGTEGMKKRWILSNTRLKGISLKFDCDQQQALVCLDIDLKNGDKRNFVFNRLMENRDKVNSFFEKPLQWNKEFQLTGKTISRICLILPEVSIYNQKQWPEIFDFFMLQMKQMEKMFRTIKPDLEEAIEIYELNNT